MKLYLPLVSYLVFSINDYCVVCFYYINKGVCMSILHMKKIIIYTVSEV